MQPCRFCLRIIPVAKPYDQTEDWICSECAKEFGGHARRINEEDLQKRYKAALERIIDESPLAFPNGRNEKDISAK